MQQADAREFDSSSSDDSADADPLPNLVFDSDSDYDGAAPVPDAEDEYIRHFIDLLLRRKLNSVIFTETMYLAGRAGLDKCRQYGLKPGSSSGHAQRKVRSTLGLFTDADGYILNVPGRSKADLGRTERSIMCYPLHELIDEDVRTDAQILEDLQEMVDNMRLPDAYSDHPIVQQYGSTEPVLPFAIFVDAVPYSLVDGVIGFWAVNLLTGRRYLIVALRKSVCCRCGCRGWCSFYEVFSFIVWSVEALKDKIYPHARHDGTVFGRTDSCRAAKAGQSLFARCAFLYVKGDWAEFSTTVGVPSWRDNLRACFRCNLARGLFYDLRYCCSLPQSFPCGLTRNQDYMDACDRCECEVVVNEELHRRLVPLLKYDKRPAGNHGLVLRDDVAGTDLKRGMRIEPSPALRNIGNFFHLTVFPVVVTFWKVASETITRHRNPLFRQDLGLGIESLTIDSLHCLFLGVYNTFCAFIIWLLLDSNSVVRGSNIDERKELFAIALKSNLRRWYPAYERAHGVSLTRINDFTSKMLGERDEKKIKTKGAETWGLLLFLMDFLTQHPIAEQGRWLAACQCLSDLIQLWDAADWKLTEMEICRSHDLFNRFSALTHGVESLEVPKKHLFGHLVFDLDHKGNPRYYATWKDEALNKLFKNCCREVSQLTFEKTVLSSIRELLVVDCPRERCERR